MGTRFATDSAVVFVAKPDTLVRSLNAEAAEVLAGDRFPDLPDLTRVGATRELLRHPGDRRARNAIEDLADLPGFAALRPDEQLRFLRRVGGTTALASDERAAFMRWQCDRDNLLALPVEQAERLRQLFIKQPGLGRQVAAEPELLDRKPVAHRLGARSADFVSALSIDGRSLPIKHYDSLSPGASQHSAAEVAEAIASLPAANRALIQEVHILPVRSQYDAYMTCGAEGQIRIYAADLKQTPAMLRISLLHETGHALTMSRLDPDSNKPAWEVWRKAMQDDQLSVSTYARTSAYESAAEPFAMLSQVRGTEKETEVRALLPEESWVFDRLFAINGR